MTGTTKNRRCPHFAQTFSHNTQRGIPESLHLFCCFPLLPLTVIQLLPQLLNTLQNCNPRAHHHRSCCRTSPLTTSTKSCNTRAEAAGHKWWRQNSQILQSLITTLMKQLTCIFPPFREHFCDEELNLDCRGRAHCLASPQSSTWVAKRAGKARGCHRLKPHTKPEIRDDLC